MKRVMPGCNDKRARRVGQGVGRERRALLYSYSVLRPGQACSIFVRVSGMPHPRVIRRSPLSEVMDPGSGGGAIQLGVGGFDFGWWVAMEDALWTVPLLRYSGDSGVPGRRRYRPATPYARLLHRLDRGGRSGTAPTRGLAVLSFRGGWATLQNRVFHTPRQPKGAGSSCRPHRSNMSNIAEASGSREQRRKRLRHGGHRGLLGSVRPLRVSA